MIAPNTMAPDTMAPDTIAPDTIAPDMITSVLALGLDARAALNALNAYPLFASLDYLVLTGPTRTNVNDFRAILVI